MVTRRTAVAAMAGAPFVNRLQAAKRPNFLFLIGDDHAAYALGADGNRQAVTPNLDRLAAGGTYFAGNYCNAPVCTPSRQSFLTGLLPHATGVTRLPTALSEEKATLADKLKTAGYLTAVFNKMHFNRPSQAGMHGFDRPMIEGEVNKGWSAAGVSRKPGADVKTKAMPWRPFRSHAREWLNSANLPYPRYDADMRGTYVAGQAGKFFEENKGNPFAVWVSFNEPHSPFDFPIEDAGRFRPRDFEVPRVGPEDAWQVPLIFQDLTPEEKQGIIAAYYTSTHFLDRNIGRVLDALKRNGLEENTLVVYLGDNGYSLGHHGRFEKHCCYEPAIRVPLIMRLPGTVKRGVVRDLTECVDIAPTVLDMLNAEPLKGIHGQSLRAYLEGRKPPRPRDYIFSEYLENEEACVRTAQWKYVHGSGKRERDDGYKTGNPTPGRWMRLFDVKSDPGEFTDVAKKNPKVVNELQALLLKRFRDTHPEAPGEPKGLGREEAIEWYLRPRDV